MPIDIALQMWTVRQQMRAGAVATIAAVADAGYPAVELVGYGDADAATVRDALEGAGVQAISQHVPYPRLADDLDAVIAENVALGCTWVMVQQGRHEDWVDDDAVRGFAATCTRWGRRLRDAGLTLGHHGYHKMDLEFAPSGPGTRWDLFAESVDPEFVVLQLDTYWVRRSGEDPVSALDRFRGRVPTLHLKDTDRDPGGTDTTVGDGLMDLADILAAAQRNGTRWVIVEQEGDPGNALSDIRRSRANTLAALAGLGGAA